MIIHDDAQTAKQLTGLTGDSSQLEHRAFIVVWD
jgi:hypothetical protein